MPSAARGPTLGDMETRESPLAQAPRGPVPRCAGPCHRVAPVYLPGPGGVLKMDMRQIGRPAGWIVVAALRVGNVIGAPTEPMAWLDPLIG